MTGYSTPRKKGKRTKTTRVGGVLKKGGRTGERELSSSQKKQKKNRGPYKKDHRNARHLEREDGDGKQTNKTSVGSGQMTCW